MAKGGIETIGYQAQALQLYAERGRVLASNIANADTPNYKARDFNFQTALAQATSAAPAAASGPVAMAKTAVGHLGTGAAAPGPTLLYRQPLQSALDGNTVDVDAERANFAQNSVRYEATLRFMNAQIKQMMSAINGQ
jgi:flagellar basal-body rod protein FlgB